MTPHSCHNIPRLDGYYAKSKTIVMDDKDQPEGLVLDQIVEWVENRNTKECQYRRHVTDDPRCEGCGN